MHKNIQLNEDAFSSGQIGSKIWLCEKLEQTFGPTKEVVWILGGWYGISAFLLLTRGVMNIEAARSFDVDPECEKIADKLLNNWVWQKWKFKSYTKDCNTLSYKTSEYGPTPTMVVNTACEHFETKDWYNNIPAGTKIALQSNNMENEDHFGHISSITQMQEMYPLSNTLFTGEKTFNYPDWSFTRFMLIGIK